MLMHFSQHPKAVTKIFGEPAKLRGMGDVVAVVAQPIARAIDAVARTNVPE